MTIGGTTAYRGPNPDCETCGGTGEDPAFHTDCTECWPTPDRLPFRAQTIAERTENIMRLREQEYGEYLSMERKPL